MHTQRPQSGFTLIEVLVAILILSIGVLGATGMQFAALQANKEARNQAEGVRYAQELADRMRANRLIFAAAAGNPYFTDWAAPADAPSAKNCLRDSCTALEVAAWDLSDTIKRVTQDNGLPKARLVVCSDTNPYDADGLPRWACGAGAGADGTIFIKLGWTQADFNSDAGKASTKNGLLMASAQASRPLVVFPVSK